MNEVFRIGDRVQIAETYYWAQAVCGTISQPPPHVADLLEGAEPWEDGRRTVPSAHGLLSFYWVEFDEAQRDPDGDGPYQAGEIDARYLTRVEIH